MKKVYYTICMLAALCVTTSCDDFLDKMPDKRAEINSSQKISELLVSAYPNVDPMMIYEHRTDNVMDNGRRFGEPERMIVENYSGKTSVRRTGMLPKRCGTVVTVRLQQPTRPWTLSGYSDLTQGMARKGERPFCAGHMLTSYWSTRSVSRIVKVLQVLIWEFLMWKSLRQLSGSCMTEERSLPYMKRLLVI